MAPGDRMLQLGAWYYQIGLVVDHVCSPVDSLAVYNVLHLVCLVLCHVGKSCEKEGIMLEKDG